MQAPYLIECMRGCIMTNFGSNNLNSYVKTADQCAALKDTSVKQVRHGLSWLIEFLIASTVCARITAPCSYIVASCVVVWASNSNS